MTDVRVLGETLASAKIDLCDRYECAFHLWEHHGVLLFNDEDKLRQARTIAIDIRQRRGVTPMTWYLLLPLVAVGVVAVGSCVMPRADGAPLGPFEGAILLAILAGVGIITAIWWRE